MSIIHPNVTIIHRKKFFHVLGCLNESSSHVGRENVNDDFFVGGELGVVGSDFSGKDMSSRGCRRRTPPCSNREGTGQSLLSERIRCFIIAVGYFNSLRVARLTFKPVPYIVPDRIRRKGVMYLTRRFGWPRRGRRASRDIRHMYSRISGKESPSWTAGTCLSRSRCFLQELLQSTSYLSH